MSETKLDRFSESGASYNALTYFGQTVTTASGTLHYPFDVILLCVRWYVAYPYGESRPCRRRSAKQIGHTSPPTFAALAAKIWLEHATVLSH